MLRIVIIILSVIVSIRLHAQNLEDCLSLMMKDGSTTEVFLSSRPTIQLNQDELVINAGHSKLSFDLTKVANYTFTKKMSGMTWILDGSHIDIGNERIEFSECSTIRKISLTNMSGIIVRSATINAGELFSLPLTDLQTGVYILTVNGISTKITRL